MNAQPFDLTGKTILILGASSGIGRATALRFAEAGACVVAHGRDIGRLQSLRKAMAGKGHSVAVADLADRETVRKLVDDLPPLDGAVFSAGVGREETPLKFTSDDTIEKILRVDLESAVYATQALMKTRKINKGGAIVYIASIAGMLGASAGAVYGAAKAGLLAFTRYMSVEFAARAVRVNAISPGMVETPMTREFIEKSPERYAADVAKYPFGYGKPEDVACAAQYLMSAAAARVSGINLVLDGGYSARQR